MYYAVFRINGKQKWIPLNIENKRGNKTKADKKLKEILVMAERNPNMFDKIDFCAYAKKWLHEVKSQVDTMTFEGYKQHLEKHIIPHFEPLKLAIQDIRVSHIEEYYKAKMSGGRLDGKEGGLSRASVKRHSVVLSLIFKQARANELIIDNPCEAAVIPKAKQQMKRTDFYSVEQCKQLLEITDNTILHDMIQITFLYGLRRSEMIGLRWKDIDFINDTITIQHTVVVNGVVERKDRTKNSTSNRIYPLLPDIKQMLNERKSEQNNNRDLLGSAYVDTPYIFVKADGNTYYPDYPTKMLEKVLERNKLPHIRWHDLRHSCASMLIDKGWSMKDVSDWLGHADIGTTMNIYGHLSMEHKRKAAASLDGMLN